MTDASIASSSRAVSFAEQPRTSRSTSMAAAAARGAGSWRQRQLDGLRRARRLPGPRAGRAAAREAVRGGLSDATAARARPPRASVEPSRQAFVAIRSATRDRRAAVYVSRRRYARRTPPGRGPWPPRTIRAGGSSGRATRGGAARAGAEGLLVERPEVVGDGAHGVCDGGRAENHHRAPCSLSRALPDRGPFIAQLPEHDRPSPGIPTPSWAEGCRPAVVPPARRGVHARTPASSLSNSMRRSCRYLKRGLARGSR